MAYYTARQQENGKWYYTCQTGDMVFTMDCCKNCGGHESEHEALECRRLHNIKTSQIRWNDEAQHKCAICKAWTQSYRIIDADFPKEYYLCPLHNNVENLDILTKTEEKIVAKKVIKDWSAVPETLHDDLLYLDTELEDSAKTEIKNYVCKDDDHFYCYLIGGSGMRNAWGLWHDSPLAHWFRKRGIWHADDMSGIIGTAYYHHIVGDVDVDDEWMESERLYYDNYWKNSGADK